MEEELSQTGVHGYFHHDEETATGTCAVIVKDNERALCANLGACVKYPLAHLEQNIGLLKNASLIYTSAFFITSNFDALITVGKLAAENNIPLGYNLSATFLIQFNTNEVNSALEYADYVFCNEDEAKVFAEVNKIEHSSLEDVVKVLAQWKKANSARPRVAIITQGKSPVLVATHSGAEETTTFQVEIPEIAKEKIVDTNGAGDSFVGGFLS